MSGPFKMKGSGHYGHGNQKRKDGMPYAEYAQMAGAALGAMSKKDDDEGSKEPVGLDKENMPKSGAKYASPAKEGKTKFKEKVKAGARAVKATLKASAYDNVTESVKAGIHKYKTSKKKSLFLCAENSGKTPNLRERRLKSVCSGQ